jgi:hypothetical protein
MDGEPVRKTAGLADSLDGKSRALTIADIAKLLNISERQVYKLAAEHRIPVSRLEVPSVSIPWRLPSGCARKWPLPPLRCSLLRKTGYWSWRVGLPGGGNDHASKRAVMPAVWRSGERRRKAVSA